jgi:hypothetical protein
LYPANLRDVLLGAAYDGHFIPSWSSETIDEMARNLVADGRVDADGAARLTAIMRSKFPRAETVLYEGTVSVPVVHADDRHVAVAAVEAAAAYLVTSNLKHFPAEALAPFKVDPVSPDAFLSLLVRESPVKRLQSAEPAQSPFPPPGRPGP